MKILKTKVSIIEQTLESSLLREIFIGWPFILWKDAKE
jgi:hypothetical protein